MFRSAAAPRVGQVQARAHAGEPRDASSAGRARGPPRCCGPAARSAPAGRGVAKSPATYASPNPTRPRSASRRKKSSRTISSRCHSVASGSPNRCVVPSGSRTSRPPSVIRPRPFRMTRSATLASGPADGRGSSRSAVEGRAAIVIGPTPGRVRTAASEHGNSLQPEPDGLQVDQAGDASRQQRVAGERAQQREIGQRLPATGQRGDERAAAVLLDVDARVEALAGLRQEEAVRLVHPEKRRHVELLRMHVAAQPSAARPRSPARAGTGAARRTCC